ncbi:MAG: Fic family protein [bacterium]
MYKIEKPRNETDPDRLLSLVSRFPGISKYVEAANRPEYLYWDKVKFKPHPEQVTAEEIWALAKLLRQYSSSRRTTPIRNESGETFSWQLLPGQDQLLHEFDLGLGGRLISQVVENDATRQQFLSRGVMEEAIASSQLEGANTTRRAAKRILLEKRRPTNKSEKMIVNNYQAMIAVEEELRRIELSIEALLNLHVTITKDTIDTEQVGRLRKDSDKVVVCDPIRDIVYHIPPKRDFLIDELDRLIGFANDSNDEHTFVHPIVKAIMLHFWIGYLHPFVDGNGRLARIVFYWYLLRKDYWAFSYLPISRAIKNSPAQYRDAFIYTEQDDNDLNYFIDYNLRKIGQVKRDFEKYVERKETENRKMAALVREKYRLNDRQIQLLRYFHKNAGVSTSIKTHANVYDISRPTARKDLEYLESLGLLTSEKLGRDRPFYGTAAIAELF